MFSSKPTHHFSLAGSFPRYLYSEDDAGNRCVQIELISELTSISSRVAPAGCVFHDVPELPNFKPSYGYYAVAYFELMEKIATCFEFMPLSFFLDVLRWGESPYPGRVPSHLAYQPCDGYVDMRKGPFAMLMTKFMAARAEDYQYPKARGRVNRIVTESQKILGRKRAPGQPPLFTGNGLHRMRKLLTDSERLPVRMARAAIDRRNAHVPIVNINGVSLVLEEDVHEIDSGYIERHPEHLMHVHGIGLGVSTLDLFSRHIEDVTLPQYRFLSKRTSQSGTMNMYGPLYPSILFADPPKHSIVTVDKAFFE